MFGRPIVALVPGIEVAVEDGYIMDCDRLLPAYGLLGKDGGSIDPGAVVVVGETCCE